MLPSIVIGVGVVTYYAVYPIIDIIPFEWGDHDEDGDWRAFRDTAQIGLAMIGTLLLISGMESNGKEAWLRRLNKDDVGN